MFDKNAAHEWKSPDDLQGLKAPATLNEFQNPEMLAEPSDAARREFLKIMGAGVAVAGFAGCARPVEKIVPEVNRPDQFTPGAKVWYSSACQGCADACGVVVKTIDGRPLKLEGRKASLVGRGALCASAQAATYDLYDPERLQSPLVVGQPVALKALDETLLVELRQAKSVRWLRGAYPSEVKRQAVASFLASFAEGKDVVWSAISSDAALKVQEAIHGTRVLPRIRLDKADRVLDLGSDFLNGSWGRLDLAKDLSRRRDLEANKEPLRLTTIEGLVSHTGTNADDRIVIRQSLVADAGFALAAEVSRILGSKDSRFEAILSKHSVESFAGVSGVATATLKALAKDLADHKGKAVVFAADTVRGQLAATILNVLLGAEGTTLDGVVSPSLQFATGSQELSALVAEMDAGKVDVLFIDGVNPAYSLPDSSGFRKALAKVKTVVSLSLHRDETAELAGLVLPTTHWLEDWNVAEPQKGVYQLAQPTIAPLYKDVRSSTDSLLAWTKALGKATPWNSATAHEAVRGFWADLQKTSNVVGSFEAFWEDGLRSGGYTSAAVRASRETASAVRPLVGQDLSGLAAAPKPVTGVEIAPYWAAGMRDGSQGNNPHIQELPDPVTKMVWGNAALVGPKRAADLGVKSEDFIQLETAAGPIELPVFVVPGMHKDVVGIALGYGRTAKLRMLQGDPELPIWTELAYSADGKGIDNKISTVGVDVGKLALAGTAALESISVANATRLAKDGRLSTTQSHHDLAHQEKPGDGEWRQVAIQVNWEEYAHDKKAGLPENHVKLFTLWGDAKFKDAQQWGMAIDLNKCNGCSACVVGCHVENNVPMVGFEEVRRGRDMHWLRIDRYFHGELAEPQVTHQPMLCQQCDNAPCETVCPVLATTHSEDGLNQMTYNRCIGTRYCANNCPYKVRRFNWTNNWKSQGLVDLYEKTPDGRTPNAPLAMAFNPEVTIRSRGVMEKCTFCVQRIQGARYESKELGLDKVPEGEIQTACQQSCPAEAIVFGDIKDPHSKVSKLIQAERGYKVLEWLQVKPNVTFLPRVRHTADPKAVSAAIALNSAAKEHGTANTAHGAEHEQH
ncbi:MAG: 4Fe-4S dicluster domain-containing protein [Fibrobacterota bacterium]